jgi:hypothetical protein
LCWGRSIDNPVVHRELWISWASLLRSYAAAHGLSGKRQAVVEVGVNEIVVWYGGRWVRFTHAEMESSDGSKSPFALNEDGTITLDGKIDAMDLVAERTTRELMQ